MVLDLLKFVKSAMKNFHQSEASIVVMWLPKKKILRKPTSEANSTNFFLVGTYIMVPMNNCEEKIFKKI